MESENETHPLLHDFENETWRSKARKRCLRIPSEVAITGIILGLFFVVVTLLIVLENMEDTKESSLTVDKTLLASPFKYNKKAEDKSWQDKKNDMKPKNKQNDLKWDKANKGWKQFPDISGKTVKTWNSEPRKELKEDVNNLGLPDFVDEYGRDENWEKLISLEEKDQNDIKTSYDDATDIATLLQSPKLQRKEIDENWKRLSVQGWTDKEIKDALIKALKERKEEIKETEGLLQSSMDFNELWNKINESWKKKMQEGNNEMDDQKKKNKNEMEHQKSINDEWKNKMNILQSPTSTMKKMIKADDGWKKLSEQGWKLDDLKTAMIDAWKEKQGLLQSPMNSQSLLGKSGDMLKNIMEKGLDKQKSQKDMNDEWANKFGGLLQSSMSSTKQEGGIDEIMKSWTKYDKKDKNANKGGKQDENQYFNFEDFLENIVEKIKENEKDNITKDSQTPGPAKENFDYSSMDVGDFMKKIIDVIKENQKGKKEAENQKNFNKEMKNNMNVLTKSKNPDQKWKKVDDHWKSLIEYERSSYLEKKDGSDTTNSKGGGLQHSVPQDNNKWDNVDKGWKKLTDQGWKDQDLKEAVYKAWKEGDKLLQSATGYNNMKWKKVNDGWKKISNKS